MSWVSQLYKTYENNAGKNQQDGVSMTPVAHMNANAQIEITLSSNGDFIATRIVDKADAVTLVPVTEASASRSSGVAPHALCDTLSYLAGDFEKYCQNEKLKKNAEAKFNSYMNQLQQWIESEYTHPKAKAIYHYLSKKELISDLVKAGIIELKEDSTFDNKKVGGQPYDKVLVRFRVLYTDENISDATWEDTSLISVYAKYYLSNQKGRESVCYLLGKKMAVSENHPKGIVAANYGAKLISANDGQCYTYRGRFQNSEQAYALSYEASQKIHSALTWLVKKQGAYVGNEDKRTFICWNPKGKKVPDILDALKLENDEENVDSNVSYKKKLIKLFKGYQEQFDEMDDIVVMALDAATTGRLSITYYNEFKALDFFDRIVYWGETCNWMFLKFHDQKIPYYQVETPIFERISKCAFGREQGNFIELKDKVLKEQTQRLVKCMLEKQPLPFDFVQSLTARASQPMAYSRGNRERVLSTACAMIRKYYIDKNIIKEGEQKYMKLDLENRDRSYLFGRLLAVLENVERMTYDRGEEREPNAIRLQSAYVNHPLQTWKILEDALKPYFRKLKPGSREYYRGLISEIIALLREEDCQELNQGLKEIYLIGYYLQRAELNKKKETHKEEMENE